MKVGDWIYPKDRNTYPGGVIVRKTGKPVKVFKNEDGCFYIKLPNHNVYTINRSLWKVVKKPNQRNLPDWW